MRAASYVCELRPALNVPNEERGGERECVEGVCGVRMF